MHSGMDLVMIYKTDGAIYVTDRYSTGYFEPEIDELS